MQCCIAGAIRREDQPAGGTPLSRASIFRDRLLVRLCAMNASPCPILRHRLHALIAPIGFLLLHEAGDSPHLANRSKLIKLMR
jgi:hypothetical protein